MNLDNLTAKQLAKYEDSLEVLRLMRKGSSITKASQQVGISPSTVKKYVGSVLYSKNNKLVARKTDTLLRQVRIYENGQEDFILVKGRKNVTILAQYMSAVGRRIDKGDTSALKSFEKITIIDSNGKHHKLETDIKKLKQIHERREEPEFFTIYSRRSK